MSSGSSGKSVTWPEPSRSMLFLMRRIVVEVSLCFVLSRCCRSILLFATWWGRSRGTISRLGEREMSVQKIFKRMNSMTTR